MSSRLYTSRRLSSRIPPQMGWAPFFSFLLEQWFGIAGRTNRSVPTDHMDNLRPSHRYRILQDHKHQYGVANRVGPPPILIFLSSASLSVAPTGGWRGPMRWRVTLKKAECGSVVSEPYLAHPPGACGWQRFCNDGLS